MKTDQGKKTKSKSIISAQLAAYSATATAVLLAAPAAQGTIQNISSSTLTLAPSDSFSHQLSLTLRVFHGAMLIQHTAFSSTFGGAGHVTIQGNLFLNQSHRAYNLNLGDHMLGSLRRPGAFITSSFVTAAYRFSNGTVKRSSGDFLPAANQNIIGYAGFKAQQNGQTYYGWLRVQVHADDHDFPDQVSILTDGNGYVGAYGLAGDDVTAGQIAPAPEPGTMAIGGLGLLALGARGVRELRRRREPAAKN